MKDFRENETVIKFTFEVKVGCVCVVPSIPHLEPLLVTTTHSVGKPLLHLSASSLI